VAQLVGTPRINLLAANRTDGMVQVKNSVLNLPAPAQALPVEVLLGIRPEDVRLDPQGKFNGQIALREPLGVETILHIRSGEQTLLSLIPGMSDLQLGTEVRFNLSPEKLHWFNTQGQRITA
jgi:ABC-type sugar transport system ATPase subunit